MGTFSLADSELILKTLDNSVIKSGYNSENFKLISRDKEKLSLRDCYQLEEMIKDLPIFQRYTSSQRIVISKKTTFAINSCSKASIKNLFDDYLLVNSEVLIKSTLTDLNSSLFFIYNISLATFYKMFLYWSWNKTTWTNYVYLICQYLGILSRSE